MKRSQREAAARGSTHLLRLSLPAVRSNGSFEGADIIAEADAVPAVLLCQVYRGVMSWALTPAVEHDGLFPPGAGAETRRLLAESVVPEELRPVLETLCELFDDPRAADPQRVAEACMYVGEWADRRGDAPATALRFLQAGATCSPNDARMAYRAGYVARRQAVWDVAELWFRHSSTVSRRSRDWESHARAYVGLGYGYLQQGRYAAARREEIKALRVSQRHGLRQIQAKACHDLFVISFLTDSANEAEQYARNALQAYGAGHENIPALAHDIAYFWITRGEYARALPVYRALLPHFVRAEDRVRVLGNVGRAAGACGLADVFEEAWEEVWSLMRHAESSSASPPSVLQLAVGAMALSDWKRSEVGARFALEHALQRGEADVVVEAELVLAAVKAGTAYTTQAPAVSTSNPETQRLVDDLVTALLETVG